jgi:hypothetical protein
MVPLRFQGIDRHKLAGALLVPIPILAYWVYWTLNPSYWFNADPGALYFIDSLGVFVGESYQYVDHPGTPIHLIGSFLLALAYPFFESREAFIQFFLSRPNVFFFMSNVFLLAINITCALVFYQIVFRDLKQYRLLGAISIPLLFFALHPYSYPSLTLWSHNSLNFPIGTLLLLWLYSEMRASVQIRPLRLVLLGMASGILSIAQMYFFAWLAMAIFTLAVYVLRREKSFGKAFASGAYVALGGLIGVTLMLIPIYEALPRFLAWIIDIVTHSGVYGTGESGLFSAELLSVGIANWWGSIRAMLLLLFASMIFLGAFGYWSRKNDKTLRPEDFAMLSGLVFHIILIVFVLSKAPLKLRYSLSLAAILPVLLFMILKLFQSTPWKGQWLQAPLHGLILLGVVVTLITQIQIAERQAYIEQDAQLARVQAINRLAQEKNVKEEDLVIVYTFSTPLKCSGLLHAMNWTGNFKTELGQLCPNQHAFWDSTIELNMPVPQPHIDEIDWDLVVWPGNGSNLPEYLESVGATIIPDSWHVRRNKWFYIHGDVLGQ